MDGGSAVEQNSRASPMSTTTGPIPRPALRLVRTPPTAAARAHEILARAQFRMERRRRLTLIGATAVATLIALVRVVAARHDRLGAAAGAHHLLDHVLTIVWGGVLVVGTYAAAVKPKPVRAAALGALLSGPVAMPLVFGARWGAFEIVVATAAVVAALLPAPKPLGTRR